MANKQIHACLDVRGALTNWSNKTLSKLVKDDEGNFLNATEAKSWLMDHLEQGHKVIPFGEPCEGFDYSGDGCPGHLIPDGETVCAQVSE